jgi:hypothetical protein
MIEWILLGGFAYQMNKADKYDEEAREISNQAYTDIAEANLRIEKKQASVDKALKKLINRKKGILNTTIPQYIKTYEKLMGDRFKRTDDFRELLSLKMTEDDIEELNTMVIAAAQPMTEGQMMAQFIFTGIPGIVVGEAKRGLAAAQSRADYADVVVANAESYFNMLDAIEQRSNRMSDVLGKLNVYFFKAINEVNRVVEIIGEESEDSNQYDCIIGNCFNFAYAIKDILLKPLLDKDGKVSKLSVNAVCDGEKLLKHLERIM